jgi:HEAT repeat protein
MMDTVNTQSGTQIAAAIYERLVGRHLVDKYRAIDDLNLQLPLIDKVLFRSLILRAIRTQYYPGKEDEDDDPSIAQTRSWLVSALGRVSAGDNESTTQLRVHIDQNSEPYHWARYWALEGLIAGRNPEATQIAKELSKNEADRMVSMLAYAYMAAGNDQSALKRLKECLAKQDTRWFVLRALRVIPIPSTVNELRTLVEKAEYSDETYDAIMALGVVPSSWTHAAKCAHSLSSCVVKLRGSPWKDGMRTAAIAGLGNLKIESSGPLLVEELADDNPAIVREAARSIEKVLGVRTTVGRVVEVATRGSGSDIDAFAQALRWLNREAVAEELETLMGSGSGAQPDIARALLIAMGGAVAFQKLRARTAAMKQYGDTLEKAEEKIGDLFKNSIEEAQRGFHVATWMDVVVFAIGLVLILASAGHALFKTGDFATWVGVGGVGVLGVLYGLLISNPRQQIRLSVDHLMRVKILFLAYLRRLHQADQAYTRRLLEDEPITAEQVRSYTDIVGSIMETTALQLIDIDRRLSADPGNGGDTGREKKIAAEE